MNWNLALNFLIAMLAIANPVGKIPFWVEAAGDEAQGVRWRLAVMVTGSGGLVLLASLLLGRQALELFGIDLAAFRVGGGLVLVTIGLQMIRGTIIEIEGGSDGDDEGSLIERARVRFRHIFVPMCFPLIAGPGSITTAIVYSSRIEELPTLLALSLSLAGVLLLILIALLVGHRVREWVGDIPLAVTTRVFGLLLVGIAAQHMLEGLGEVFPAWLQERSPIEEEVEQNLEQSSRSG
jgi:multiple antibiotic resistance protein